MNESRLIYLFVAYFNRTSTPAERDELMDLVEQGKHNAELQELLTSTWQQFNSTDQPFTAAQGDAMLTDILSKARTLTPPKAPVRMVSWKKRIAVAATILLLLSAAGYYWFDHTEKNNTALVKELPTDSIVPGTNKAMLVLADGSSIALTQDRVGSLPQQGTTAIVNVDAAVLAYKQGKKMVFGETLYNTLSTPRGGQYKLILTDGTRVWLNASSSIRFPVAFTGNQREVTVTGEAYFEVAPDKNKPFVVTAREAKVQVLGTHFNVMAYEDEPSINTTLLEGRVQVFAGDERLLLLPGQVSRFKPGGHMEIENVDTDEAVAWKEGLFDFKKYPVEKIMRQVARWYDVDVIYKGPIPAETYSAMLNRDNSLGAVLKIMQEAGVQFDIEGHRIIVSSGSHSK